MVKNVIKFKMVQNVTKLEKSRINFFVNTRYHCEEFQTFIKWVKSKKFTNDSKISLNMQKLYLFISFLCYFLLIQYINVTYNTRFQSIVNHLVRILRLQYVLSKIWAITILYVSFFYLHTDCPIFLFVCFFLSLSFLRINVLT